MNFVDVGCAILAAGQSTRMGKGKSKPLLPWMGNTLVQFMATHTEDLFMQSFVVAGDSYSAIVKELDGCEATVLANPNHKQGLSTSLKVLANNPIVENLDGLFLFLCDQPLIERNSIRDMLSLFEDKNTTVVSQYPKGKRGVPCLLHKRDFSLLGKATGDKGLSSLLQDIEVEKYPLTEREMFDIDTPEDYQKALCMMEISP